MSTTVSNSRTVRKLASGDRLTRDEFERRDTAMTHVKKAELIDGEVYMPMPVSWENHGSPHAEMMFVFSTTARLAPDMSAVLQTLMQGIASPEHAKFVEALRSRSVAKS